MNGFAKYLSLFKTVLIKESPSKIIIDPIKIEIFNESRIFEIPVLSSSILSKNSSLTLSKNPFAITKLRDGENYIAIVARTRHKDPWQARNECEEAVDKIITNVSIIYDPSLFSDLVYRGWIFEENSNIFVNSWVKFTEKVSIDGKRIVDEMKTISKLQNMHPGLLNRFRLMSKFYSKSIIEKSDEPRYIWLWTILEIFPMQDTTNIKPISEYLSVITGKSFDFIKGKLWIGELYDIRCKLIHNGKFPFDPKKMGIIFSKLEDIVIEVLRTMNGYGYSGKLDKYF